MKKAIAGLSVLIFFFGFVPSALSAGTGKIGVFIFQKILNESSAGKIVQKQIKAKGDGFQKKILAEKNQLDELRKSFEREALVLSTEKQQEKQREYRIRVNDFKKMQETFGREFKQLELQSINKIQKAIFEITGEIGKKEGYSLILERKTGGVVFAQDQLDITDQVIKLYNSKSSK
jgi:outer membrane protein